MKAIETNIPDVLIIEPKVLGDDRSPNTPVILSVAKDLKWSNREQIIIEVQ